MHFLTADAWPIVFVWRIFLLRRFLHEPSLWRKAPEGTNRRSQWRVGRIQREIPSKLDRQINWTQQDQGLCPCPRVQLLKSILFSQASACRTKCCPRVLRKPAFQYSAAFFDRFENQDYPWISGPKQNLLASAHNKIKLGFCFGT